MAYNDASTQKDVDVNIQLFEDIVTQLNCVYENLFFVALKNGRDIWKVAKEVENQVFKTIGDNNASHPRGFDGLLFVAAISKELGSSFFDAIYMTCAEKAIILQDVLNNLILDCEQDGYKEIDRIGNERIFFDRRLSINYNSLNERAYLVLRFVKEYKNDQWEYKVVLLRSNEYEGFDHMLPSDAVIWTENNGNVSDYIEGVIRNIKINLINEENASVVSMINNVPKESEDNKVEGEYHIETSEKTMESPISNKGKKELIVTVDDGTRSVPLMDRFESHDSEGKAYQCLVIKNGMLIRKFSIRVFVNLVIERNRNSECVGDITFTEFKQHKYTELKEYITEELTEDIINEYLDADKYYRFNKPFRLRAQNSSNRTGYGWKWDWSGGIGDYTEGTYYGETTEYAFVGAYISSMYFYIPSERKEFVGNPEIKIDAVKTDVDKSDKRSSPENDSYQIVILSKDTDLCVLKGIEEHYVFGGEKGAITDYFKVFIQKEEERVYIQSGDILKYWDIISNNILFLYNGSSITIKSSNIVGLKETLSQNTISDDISREKQTNHLKYPRTEDETDYQGENEKHVINEPIGAESVCMPGIPAKKTAGIEEKFNEVPTVAEEKKIIRQPTKIIAIDRGDACPRCGKSRPAQKLIVNTLDANRLQIECRVCTCGTIYLSKKQYKKLINKSNLLIEMVHVPAPARKISSNIRGKICPICHNKVNAFFADKGICWDCFKDQMSSRFD